MGTTCDCPPGPRPGARSGIVDLTRQRAVRLHLCPIWPPNCNLTSREAPTPLAKRHPGPCPPPWPAAFTPGRLVQRRERFVDRRVAPAQLERLPDQLVV